MTKYLYIIIFSIIFSNGYNHIEDNKLSYSQDFTFEDFMSELKGKGKGRFATLWSGGVSSNTFDWVEFLDVIEYQDSMQYLAALSESALNEVIDEIIEKKLAELEALEEAKAQEENQQNLERG